MQLVDQTAVQKPADGADLCSGDRLISEILSRAPLDRERVVATIQSLFGQIKRRALLVGENLSTLVFATLASELSTP